MNEPIADAVRSILDGHVVLTRELAHAGHYPAVDVLQSVSRLTGEISAPDVAAAAQEARALLAAWHDKRDLIAIGAYERGSDPLVDRALELKPAIDAFLRQAVDAPSTPEEADDALLSLLAGDVAAGLAAEVAAESRPSWSRRGRWPIRRRALCAAAAEPRRLTLRARSRCCATLTASSRGSSAVPGSRGSSRGVAAQATWRPRSTSCGQEPATLLRVAAPTRTTAPGALPRAPPLGDAFAPHRARRGDGAATCRVAPCAPRSESSPPPCSPRAAELARAGAPARRGRAARVSITCRSTRSCASPTGRAARAR